MADRPTWLVQPCPACRHTAFWLEREKRSGVVRIVCHGCRVVVLEIERESK